MVKPTGKLGELFEKMSEHFMKEGSMDEETANKIASSVDERFHIGDVPPNKTVYVCSLRFGDSEEYLKRTEYAGSRLFGSLKTYAVLNTDAKETNTVYLWATKDLAEDLKNSH